MADFRTIGRYAIYGELASGGMATVHLGRLVGSGGFARTVAIKSLHRQLSGDPDFVAMFLDEAWLAARIQHPNVVQTLDVVNTDGELFLVMEYVHGETLSRLFRAANEPVPPRIINTIMANVLHGLHAAHEAKDESGKPLNIVHRDVSPQNVMVGIDGIGRVLDFGVAKAAVRLQTTRDGTVKGKLAYMAPEQLGSHVVTRLSDVYAAGVLLWQGLTGVRLFDAETEGRLVHLVMSGKISPPSSVIPKIPPALDAIVMRALSLEPGDCYPTARDMALALERETEMGMASEVGEWCEKVASVSLAQRAAMLAEVESQANVPRPSIEEVKAVSEQTSARAAAKAWDSQRPPESRSSPTLTPSSPSRPAPRNSAPPMVTRTGASSSRMKVNETPTNTGTGASRVARVRRRILAIDDSDVILAHVRSTLEADGYEVITTTQTVGNARHIPNCDLVIIDYHMPGITGGDVISSLRGAALASGHPCLFYLCTVDVNVARDYAKMGFDGSITDKGDDAALLRQVRAIFRMLQMRALARK